MPITGSSVEGPQSAFGVRTFFKHHVIKSTSVLAESSGHYPPLVSKGTRARSESENNGSESAKYPGQGAVFGAPAAAAAR